MEYKNFRTKSRFDRRKKKKSANKVENNFNKDLIYVTDFMELGTSQSATRYELFKNVKNFSYFSTSDPGGLIFPTDQNNFFNFTGKENFQKI